MKIIFVFNPKVYTSHMRKSSSRKNRTKKNYQGYLPRNDNKKRKIIKAHCVIFGLRSRNYFISIVSVRRFVSLHILYLQRLLHCIQYVKIILKNASSFKYIETQLLTRRTYLVYFPCLFSFNANPS